MTAPLLVDTHVHLFTAALPLDAGAWTRPEADLPVEAFEALMAEHGVDHGVIAAMSLLGDGTGYTREALRRNDRLRGTVIVPPEVSRAELEGLAADGVRGIRFMWRRAALPDLDGPEYRPLLRHVADLGWHVQLNVERERIPLVLDPLVRAGVAVVVDHFGDPDRTLGYATPGGEALLRALGTGRVRVKLSAAYRFRLEPEVLAGFTATLLAHAGPDHVFWGSDAPFVGAGRPVTYAGELGLLEVLVPDPATRHRLSAAAHAFYFGAA